MNYKNIIVSVLVIIHAACLSGCSDILFANAVVSSTTTKEENSGAIQLIPSPAFNNSNSVITLTRQNEFSQYLVNYTIAQDDKMIGLLKPGSYLQWEVNPGINTLNYRAKVAKKCYTNKEQCISKIEDILVNDEKYPVREFSFVAVEGEHYYLHFDPDWFLFTDVPRFAEIKLVKDVDLSKLNPPVIVETEQE